MQGLPRRITQAVLYEAIAISCISPAIAAIFKQDLVYSGALSATMSAIAMLWNMIFNALFERWGVASPADTHTRRRILHATGFEGGLIFILVPVVAGWLDISWLDAFVVDIGLFAFFGYAFVFQWAFDRVFDVPAATKGNEPNAHAPAAIFGNCQPNRTAAIRSAKHATPPSAAATIGEQPSRRHDTTTTAPSSAALA